MCANECHLLETRRNWKPGQPDNWSHNHEDGEDCAMLISEGLWNDAACVTPRKYICEKSTDSHEHGTPPSPGKTTCCLRLNVILPPCKNHTACLLC